MTKIEATVAALQLAEKARIEIAFCKGQIAACHRTAVGDLLPKLGDAETEAWHRGWADAKARLG